MVTVYIGPAGTGKSTAVLREICQRAQDGVSGQILLVPDLKSHEMERELCAAGGDTICRFAEVLTLSRLSQRVFAQQGQLSQAALDDAGRVLAMAQAVEAVRGELRYYSSVIAQPEFLSAFVDLSRELKSYCVTPAALGQAAREVSGSLGAKLRDLSLILGAYQSACDLVGADPRDQLTRLAELLEESGWAAGRHFVIDCFSFFTLQEQRVLEQLIRQAQSVTLCLTMEAEQSGLFDAARETLHTVKQLAGKWGKPFSLRSFDEPIPRDESLELVRQRLLLDRGTQPAVTDSAGTVTTVLARDAVAACGDAAARIGRLVRVGARYRDIAVTWPTGSGYEALVEAVFADWSVPVNLSQKRDVLQTPVFAMLLQALEVINGGWNREDVTNYWKAGFTGQDPEALDRLENYAILWNLRGSRWTRPFTLHPEGYGASSDPAEALEALNSTRLGVTEPLEALQVGLRRAKNAAQQVLALYAFVEALDLPGQLETLTGTLAARGREQEAQEYSQLYGVLIQALEQLYQVCGELQLTADRFARLLRLVLSQYSVSAIPAVADGVEAGELSAMRYRKPKHLFVLGAEEGSLPAYGSGDSLLSEEDRQTLLRLGLGLAPDGEHRLNQSLLDVYMVFSSPQKSLRVYCREGSQPSFVFTRLQALFGPSEQVSDPPPQTLRLAAAAAVGGDRGAALALEQCAASPELEQTLSRLRRAADYDLGLLSPARVRGLYGSTLNLTVSRMELWAKCRFWHFCSYGLKLEERKTADFDPLTFGTYVHFVLEGLTRQVRELGGFGRVDRETLTRLTDELMADYAAQRLGGLERQDARVQYLYSRSRRELLEIVYELDRELSVSDFAPAWFELSFGRGETGLPAIPLQQTGLRARITGVVDRVDRYDCQGQTWLRVVDYKTGSKALNFTDLSAGLSLQLPVYLFALQQAGLGKPAGMLYFPARSALVSADRHLEGRELESKRREKLARSGLVTGDPEVLSAMEHWEDGPQFLPVKLNRQGELTGSMVSDRQWQQLRDFVWDRLFGAARGIADGTVAPDPYYKGAGDNACAWCPYAAVCHGQGQQRYIKKVTQQEFWESLNGKETDHG